MIPSLANSSGSPSSSIAIILGCGLVQRVEGNARGWQLAKWVRAHAAELNVAYIIFDAKVWRSYAPDRGWAPYVHPYGNSSSTLAHRNHVHVSYSPPKG